MEAQLSVAVKSAQAVSAAGGVRGNPNARQRAATAAFKTATSLAIKCDWARNA
jgi:hypothetical protein